MTYHFNFRPETRFKDTEIGRIPEDWEVVKLGEVVDVLSGYAFKSKYFNNQSRGLPIIRIRDLHKTKTEAYYDGPYSEEYLVYKGDILISMDGEFKVDLWKGPIGLLNQRVAKIWPKDSSIEKLYLYYTIIGPLKRIEQVIGMTTVRHLSTRIIQSLPIPLPPLEEQRAIAQVLLSFDELLQTIDKQIENLEQIKKGMMEVYFTRGVFEHERFKETDIGRIPEGWEVVRLGEVISDIIKGTKPKSGGTYPYITTSYLRAGIVERRVKLEDEKLLVNEGDILLLWDGSNAGEFFKGKRGVLASTMVKLEFKESELPDRDFFFYLSKFKIEPFLRALAQGTGIPHVSRNVLMFFPIPLPPLEEQRAIAQRLREVDELIENRRKMREHVERAKRGVMDALLSGKVRVKMEVENEGQG